MKTFEHYQKKYSNLTEQEYNKIIGLLELPDIKNKLNEVNQNREKWLNSIIKWIIFIVLMVIVSIFIPLIFPIILIWSIVGIGILYWKTNKELKSWLIWKNIIQNIIEIIDSNLKYSINDSLFDESIWEIERHTKWLISNYDRIDYSEDSIEYNTWINLENNEQKTVKMIWMEFRTSIKSTDSKWRTTRSTADQAYLYKILFLKHRFKFKTPIIISKDSILTNFWWLIITLIIFWTIFSTIIYKTITQTVIKNNLGYEKLNSISLQTFSIQTVIIILIFTLITIIIVKSQKKVHMENMEFEKIFDVKCEDEIEARRLLTPTFMERLVKYSQAISNKNILTLYINNNYMYIKRDIGSWYLEFSIFSNPLEEFDWFIQFYLHTKETIWLINDLNLLYYDTWSFATKQDIYK